jgi:hypothetical protein
MTGAKVVLPTTPYRDHIRLQPDLLVSREYEGAPSSGSWTMRLAWSQEKR